MTAAERCVDERTALAFIQGALPAEQLSAVESHIEECKSCRLFLSILTGLEGEERVAPVDTAPASPASIERYTVVGEHARGGQARVLLAFDKNVGRKVALKELLPRAGEKPSNDASWRDAMARFLREAELTGQLVHPGVVPVFEIGKRPDGTLFYTMQLVRGRTLSEVLRERSSLTDRLSLLSHFLSVCHVVAYAHSRGIVHRDIKPQNIMVGDFGETVLLDWGLAKQKGEPESASLPALRADEDAPEMLTREGTVVGTPGYMSPEQADGRLAEVDERSDVYGLGAVLFEILTGRPPPLPGTAGGAERVRALCDKAPAELVGVAEKALAIEKGDRYQKASELAQDVTAFMTGGRVAAYAYTSRDLLRRFAARHKMLLGASGVTSAAILIALVFSSTAWRSELKSRLAAEASEAAATTRGQEALQEGAKLALERGDVLQARAKLRGALEIGDSLAARAIWWKLKSNSLRFTLPLASPAIGVAFAPDGREIAVATNGSGIRLVDLVTRGERGLHGGDDGPQSVAYSPDGKLLASGSSAGHLILWDLASEAPAQLSETGVHYIGRLAFSPDGKLLAVPGPSGEVVLWDAQRWAVQRELSKHANWVSGLSFSFDGRLLATSSVDATMRLWSLSSGETARVLSAEGSALTKNAFNPDGELIAAGGQDGSVRVWQVRDGRLMRVLRGHTSFVTDVAFSPHGEWLASSSHDGTVRLWNVSEGRLTRILTAGLGWLNGIAFSPDGALLATAAMQGVAVWDLRGTGGEGPGTPLDTRTASVVNRACFSPDGSRIASSDEAGRIWLWDTLSGAEVASWMGHEGSIPDVAFSPDGRFLASGSYDRTLAIWEVQTRALVRRLPNERSVWAIAYSPDGHLIVSGGDDPTTRVWETSSGKIVRSLSSTGSLLVPSLIFLPDGKQLAVGRQGGNIEIWNIGSGKLMQVLRTGSTALAFRLAVDPTGRRLASAHVSGSVWLWDLTAGTGRTLGAARGRAFGLAWDRQNDRLATASSTGEIDVWGLGSHSRRTFLANRRSANSIDFSPDGNSAVTTGDDGSVRLWDTASWQPRWYARAMVLDPAPQILTHSGWLELTPSRQMVSVAAQATQWRRAVERAQTASMEPGGPLCLANEEGMEIWDTRRDQKLSSVKLNQPFEMVSTRAGCSVLQSGRATLHRPGEAPVELASNATSQNGGDELVIVDASVRSFDLAGRQLASFGSGRGVTAAASFGDRMAIGYSDGSIEIRAQDDRPDKARIFMDTLPSPVARLAPGPRQTLVAAFVNGGFGIWDSTSGERLKLGAVHGPVRYLLVNDSSLLVVSELGSYSVTDLSPLTGDYCTLLREVWSQVPVLWRSASAVEQEADRAHPCR
jgi:WD40 repeat protein/tRNA A-37 threonylcarbamoyl transferase component Bud32